MSDINIQVRVRNGHLLRAIRRTHRNVNAFCVEFGLPPSVVGEILNFKRSPFLANGSLSACAQGICSATGLMPGELWPKEVGKMRLKRSVAEFELSQAEALAICGDSEERLMQRDLLIRWMGRLSPREVELIGMRQAGETYADIGANFGVSPVRVQQIEYSAHKKMRVGAMVDGVRRFSDVVA